jgi:hypothetical protein
MPFHPTCFDIFARLSRLHFNGKVNIDGLMRWCYREHSFADIFNFPHHPDVEKSKEQWWSHNRGHEYLAANPLFVPRLNDILKSAVKTDSEFSTRAGAFSCTDTTAQQTSRDIFDRLPTDLRLEVLHFLGSKDIANLRLASRTFRQLPIFLWRRLLRQELPWLWEAWATEEPFKWATISVARLLQDRREREELDVELASLRTVISEEMQEILDVWMEREEAFLATKPNVVQHEVERALGSRIWVLPPTQTNWFELYTDITRHWADLKGLQNRSRIWSTIGEIVNRISKYEVDV